MTGKGLPYTGQAAERQSVSEPGREFIWASHFNDRNLIAILHYRFRPVCYSDLAVLSEAQLLYAGLDTDMVAAVKAQLARRGLRLSERHLRIVR